MISYVRGELSKLSDASVVVEANGVGYLIHMPPQSVAGLASGAAVKIHTHMQVKEDGVSLFGFLTREELQLFSLLITVSGIGPKVALSLLGQLSPEQIMIAIMTDDADALTRAQGVGKKTAQRLSLELKDKIRSGDPASGALIDPQQQLYMAAGERQDAADALAALGYHRSEAVKAVMEVALEGMKADQVIRLALKKLSKT